MTIAQLVDNSELILVGELVSVDEGQSESAPAVGSLRVEELLRAPASAQKPATVRLLLPSRLQRMASDAVRYKPGQRGIWFLRRDASGGYLADHPHRLKPSSELAEVRAFLKSAPPR